MIASLRVLFLLPLVLSLTVSAKPPQPTLNASLAQNSTTVNIAAGDIEGLRKAINVSNQAFGAVDITLAANATYIFTDMDASPVYTSLGAETRKTYADGDDALPLITSKVTIHGNGATFKRQSTKVFRFFQVFVSGNLTLDHMTLQGGDTVEGGGAIDSLAALAGLSLDTVTFQNNHSQYQGGALVILNTSSIVNSQFVDNQSDEDGGAIEITAAFGTVTIKDSNFERNKAAGSNNGGAINVNQGHAVIVGSTFQHNVAQSGGALYVDSTGSADVSTVHMSANQATGQPGGVITGGGAIFSLSTGLTVQDSVILNNQAAAFGGGIVNTANALQVSGVEFANNQAGVNGGAIFVDVDPNDPAGKLSATNNCLLNDSILRSKGSINEELFISERDGFDASNNWWGAASGPTSDQMGLTRLNDTPSRAFTTKPFLTTAPAICTSAVPTPDALAPIATATPQGPCTSTDDYTVTIPKTDIPAGGLATCDGSVAHGLTIFIYDANGLPVSQFKTPITVCMRGTGTLTTLSLSSGDGKFHKVSSTSEKGFTCAKLNTPAVIQLG